MSLTKSSLYFITYHLLFHVGHLLQLSNASSAIQHRMSMRTSQFFVLIAEPLSLQVTSHTHSIYILVHKGYSLGQATLLYLSASVNWCQLLVTNGLPLQFILKSSS